MELLTDACARGVRAVALVGRDAPRADECRAADDDAENKRGCDQDACLHPIRSPASSRKDRRRIGPHARERPC
jgi:hypothetical protein